MRDWLAKNYLGVVGFIVAGIMFFLYSQEKREQTVQEEMQRKAAPVEMEVWREEGTGTACYILNHNKPNQDMDCEFPTYSD